MSEGESSEQIANQGEIFVRRAILVQKIIFRIKDGHIWLLFASTLGIKFGRSQRERALFLPRF